MTAAEEPAPDPADLAAHGLTVTMADLRLYVAEALARQPYGVYAEDDAIGLTQAETAELRSGGFDLAVHEAGPDPLAAGVAEFAAMMQTGLTVRDAAALAGVNESRIRQRLNTDPPSLLGVRVGRGWRIPAFQFDLRGKRILPGLERVLPALGSELHPVAVQRWFLAPTTDLVAEPTTKDDTTSDVDTEADTGLTPRDWLLAGLPPETVADLAARF
ncbi:MAG: hypothetical protein ACYTGW_19145 [Planctomycetota bacterium]|jgi:hypothetical protein